MSCSGGWQQRTFSGEVGLEGGDHDVEHLLHGDYHVAGPRRLGNGQHPILHPHRCTRRVCVVCVCVQLRYVSNSTKWWLRRSARTGGHVPVAEERVGHVQEFDDLGPFLRPQHVRHTGAVRTDDQDGALEKADSLLHADRTVKDHQLQICPREQKEDASIPVDPENKEEEEEERRRPSSTYRSWQAEYAWRR